jgi:LPS-assembly lipoprotein
MWSSDRRRLLRAMGVLPVALGAAVTSGGCGFRLQGAGQTLPFERFHTTIAANTLVGGDLRRAVRASGAQVVERPEEADVVLRMLAESEDREISAFSTAGRPREYLLRLRAQTRFEDAAGRLLVPDAEITVRRRLGVNDALGTFNAEEAALLYRDMRNDLVQQLVRRLAALKPNR